MEQQEQPQEINIEETKVSPESSSPDVDPVENMNDALKWQTEFAQRAKEASAEIRVVLQKYEIDMVAETKILEVGITVPISFKDLREHSPVQPVSLAETK